MNDDRPSRNRFASMACLIAVFLFAIALRTVRMNDSLWVDELHTSWTISEGLGEVYGRAAQGNQSPVFFWVQWLISSFVGQSEIALRSLSWVSANALFGSLMLYVARETRSIVAAATVGFLVAIDANLIFYSNEARPYAAVQLLIAVSAVCCYRYRQSGHTCDRLAWIFCAVFACYLHYTAGLLLIGQFVFLAFTHSRNVRVAVKHRWSRLAVDWFVIVVLLLPTASHLLDIANRRSNWEQFVKRREMVDVFNVLPSMRLVVVAAIVSLICVAIAKWKRPVVLGQKDESDNRSSRRNYHPQLVVLLICWIVLPIGIAFLLNNTDVARLFFRRYLVGVIPATYMLVGVLVAAPSTAKSRVIVALAVVGYGMSHSFTIQPQSPYVIVARHSRENWRAAVAACNLISESSRKRPVVLLRAGLIEDDYLRDKAEIWGEYSKLPVSGIYRLDRSKIDIVSLPYTNSGELEAQAIEDVRERGEAWLLLRGRQGTREEVANAIVDLIDDQFEIVGNQRFGPTLGLCELRRNDGSRRSDSVKE